MTTTHTYGGGGRESIEELLDTPDKCRDLVGTIAIDGEMATAEQIARLGLTRTVRLKNIATGEWREPNNKIVTIKTSSIRGR